MDITDGALSVQNNLNKVLAIEGASVIVTNPTSFVLHIEFIGSLAGTDVDPLLVNIYSAPPGDWSFNLNLDTPELRSALAETSPLTLQFEAEADFYTEVPTEANPDPPTIRMKLWSDSVQVHRPLIFSEFASGGVIDWLRPPSGRDYIPFTQDQVITGQQNYTKVIGDGAAMIFVIPHNLNSDDLAAVSIRENVSGGKIINADQYTVSVLDAHSVEIEFLTPPGANSLVVTILAAGPASAFQAHTHTIQQVVNLADQLDYLGEKVAYLMSLVPKAIIAPKTTESPNAISSVTSFGEILPDASLEDSPLSISSQVMPPLSPGSPVVAVPGTDLQEQLAINAAALVALQAQLDAAKKEVADAVAKGATVEEAKAISEQGVAGATKTIITVMETLALGTATLPVIWPPLRKNQPPTLLRALAGSAVNHTAVTPPDITATAVYRSPGGITLPPSSGRKAVSVPAGGHFASDGATFYPVYLGGDSLWHPVEMDREIARVAISSRAFPAGAKLDFSWSTTALLSPATFDSLKTDLFARYSMQVLAIPASPSVVSAPVVIAATDLTFAQSKETRSFSLSVSRPDGEGVSETSFTSYGVGQLGTPFPSGDVVLVIALKEFETDSNPPSTGQLSLYVPASQLTISK
jgi:hypothetical protein